MSFQSVEEFLFAIRAAFPAEEPSESVFEAISHEAHGECAHLLEQLASTKPQWLQLSEKGAMESMCALAEEWTGCIPAEAFVYYLPALMTRSFSPRTPFEENLLGCLAGYLEPGQHSTDRHTRIANLLYCTLTIKQIAVVEKYLEVAR